MNNVETTNCLRLGRKADQQKNWEKQEVSHERSRWHSNDNKY
jgi:hypothetical protein